MIATPPSKPRAQRFLRWHKRVIGICLAIFAFELGLVLLCFPWVSNWDLSSIPLSMPWIGRIWMSRYFRGLLSGLGLLNIYIGVVEMTRQLRLVFGKK